ncbi:flagellar biosynthesis regulator FlaF [Bradyrhizobium sp. 2TAF24]|uniref:flagellar biosynthesis regulator FlaF n=1 Tax=Bradyrhizobium sp. 2TAF24 TaxID=3233011 RepID=UPI003F9397F2
MSSYGAQAYARVANTTASPRDIEAQALLKAANKLQAAVAAADPFDASVMDALVFNRKLWSIFLSDALRDENPQPLDVRQEIANIGVFVMTQSAALQLAPQLDQFQALIDINRNIAAGLNGRA